MASPFPGMDPFLEEPARWSGFHARLINSISDQLANLVSPHFFVEIEQRVYITALDESDRRPIVPDVYVISGQTETESAPTAGAITRPTLVEPIYELEIRERYIEIRDALNREVIATLEVLSPFNKTPNTQGRQAFLNKRNTVMRSPVHWIEIDLLRAGERPGEVAGQSDYYALLKRSGGPGPFEVWYFNLRDQLPTIAMPLRPPFADVPLDLQAAFEDVYARAHYADSLDYERPVPPPSLRPAEENWVKKQVQSWLAKK